MKTLFVILVFWFPAQLFAHAEEPAAKSIFKTESGLLIQANFGVISDSIDGYVCEEAFIGGDAWKIGVFSDTEWLVYGSDNIKRTEDGCTFETIKDVDSIVGDIRISPDQKTVVYFANGGSEPGIWFSKDRGRTFTIIDFDVAGLQLTRARFENDSTLLVSGYDTTKEGQGFLLSISTQTLEPEQLTIQDGVTFPYLLDANENGIIWLGRLDERQTIFVGSKENTDEVRYIPSTWPIGAALSLDGQTIYVGGVNDGAGIAVGERETGEFKTIVEDNIIDCLDRIGEKIYTCGLERRDGFDVFELENETLKGITQFTNIDGPRSDCNEESPVTVVCPIVWKEAAQYFGKEPPITPTPDVEGSNDMGMDANSSAEPSEPIDDGGCSCSSTNPSTFSAFLLFALFFLRKRKR